MPKYQIVLVSLVIGVLIGAGGVQLYTTYAPPFYAKKELRERLKNNAQFASLNQEVVEILKNQWSDNAVYAWSTKYGIIYASDCDGLSWLIDCNTQCNDGGTSFFDGQGKFLMNCYGGFTGSNRCDNKFLASLKPDTATFEFCPAVIPYKND